MTRKILIGCLLAPLWAAPLAAQQTTNFVTDANSTGVVPFRSYAGARENIDLKNLNLNIVIPLFSLKGRDGMDVEVVVSYNSVIREWVEKQNMAGVRYQYEWIPAGGASDYPELFLGPELKHLGEFYLDQENGQTYHPNRYLVRTPDGTRHDLRDKDHDVDVTLSVYNSLERARAVDGTFLEYRESDNSGSGTLYTKDGTQVSFAAGKASWIRDTNGNLLSYSYPSSSVTRLTDTMGRVVERTVAGAVTTVKVLDAAGQYLNWSLDNTPTGTGPWTTKLTLATDNGSNQQRFLFEWNDFGPLNDPDGTPFGIYQRRLTKITYPTGGYTRYLWALNGVGGSGTASELTGRCVAAGVGQPESCWSYPDLGIETKPDGSVVKHFFSLPAQGQETKTEWYSPSGVLMKTVDRDWTFQRDVPLLTRETTTLNDANRKSKVEYDYDTAGYVWGGVNWSNGNVVQKREYDWGTGAPGALLRKTTRTWWNTTAAGTNGLRILDRPLQQIVYDGSGVQQARTDWLYDSYASPRTLVSVSGAVQRDASFGTSYTTRGNLSRTGRWVSGSTYLYSWNRFDVCGNVVEATDPRGYTTYIRYNSAYQFARPYEVEDPKGFKDTFVYDFSNTYKRGFGLVTRQTDPNGASTDFGYDRWGRLKTADYPDGGYEDRYYSDTDLTATRPGYVFNERANPPYPRVKSYTGIDTGLERVSTNVLDGLGRDSMGGTSNGIAGKTDWTRTEYDGNGRLLRTSNPRTLALTSSQDSPTASSFTKWTTLAYDGLDRIVETTTPDGQKVTVSYSGDYTTMVDQALFQRKTKTDALGRIVQTLEPDPDLNNFGTGSYTTGYAWTALDKLKTVTQGAQSRSFSYDGLGRLTSETHPEWGAPGASAGTATYAYDGDSNLTSRTDAAGTVTTNAYDQLNRLTSTSYSDATPSVTYTHDSAAAANGKRRRTGMDDGSGTRSYQYDPMGRVSEIVWTNAALPGALQTGNFAYNLAGGMKSSAWPGIFDGSTALTIYWSYDTSGKQTAAWWSNAGQSVHQQQLVDGYTFDYTGSSGTTWAVETTALANGTVETVTYNDRMQPRQRKLTNPSVVWLLDYDFTDGAGKNNGDVWGIDEGSPGYTSNRDGTFTYDWLNRIKTANVSGQWGLSFSFDRWGNRVSQSATSGNPATNALTFNQNRNRITTSGSNSYDWAGNLLGAFGQTWQYDAENRIKTVNGGSTATYSYDGDGRRAKRVGDGETRHYFYDPDGNPVWEYKPGVGWESFNFHFSGRHLAVNNTTEGLRWRHQDHLGSLRVKTDSTGAVKCRYWYYPYGELWSSTCQEKDARKFTDKERDPESGLDYFGARYYASGIGRFLSVDPKSWSQRHLATPQKWNRFSYVLNNPVRLIDPDGREEMTLVVRTFIPFERASSPMGTFNGGTKTLQAVKFETDRTERRKALVSNTRATGITKKYDANDNEVGIGQSSGQTLKAGARWDSKGNVTVRASGNESNPLYPAALGVSLSPGITYDLSLKIGTDGSYSLTGFVDGFPAYKVTLVREDGTEIELYSYDPVEAGRGVFSLYPWIGDTDVAVQGTLPPKKEDK